MTHTDQQQPTAAQRQAVGTLGRLYRGWSHDRTDAYLTVLTRWPADIITEAIQAVAAEWRSQDPPPVARIVDEARDITADRRAQRRQHVEGIGQGCPHCRHHGIQGDWTDGGNGMTWCATHSTAWRGVLPNAGADPGPEATYSEWAANITDGDYPADVKAFVASHTRWVAARPGKPGRVEPVYDLPPILQRVIAGNRNAA